MEIRLESAEAVLFLDLPPGVCAVRVVERWRSSRRRQPVDLPDGMRHRINRRASWHAVRLRRWPTPPSIVRLREQPDRLIVLRSKRDVERLVGDLELEGGPLP
jgi:hypothetical protein